MRWNTLGPGYSHSLLVVLLSAECKMAVLELHTQGLHSGAYQGGQRVHRTLPKQITPKMKKVLLHDFKMCNHFNISIHVPRNPTVSIPCFKWSESSCDGLNIYKFSSGQWDSVAPALSFRAVVVLVLTVVLLLSCCYRMYTYTLLLAPDNIKHTIEIRLLAVKWFKIRKKCRTILIL